VLLLLILVPAILANGVVYLVTFPFFAAVVLQGIWAKGWFVPDEPTMAPGGSAPSLEPPPKREPIGVRKVLQWTVAVAAVVAFAYGPIEVKAATMGLVAIWLLVWFWTAFDYR